MTGPWYLAVRYRWTLAFIVYMAYLIVVIRLTQGHW